MKKVIRGDWTSWNGLKGKGFDVEYDWEIRFIKFETFDGLRLLSILMFERSVKTGLSQWNLETWAGSKMNLLEWDSSI